MIVVGGVLDFELALGVSLGLDMSEGGVRLFRPTAPPTRTKMQESIFAQRMLPAG